MTEHEIRHRCAIRDQLESDLAEYLGNGGAIERLDQSKISGESPRFNNKGKGVNYGEQED